MLDRFLPPLGASWGVFLAAELEPEVNCGLWFAEAFVDGFVKTGDGSGINPGVLAELLSCVDNTGVRVSREGRFCLEKFADSGSSNVSICSVSIGSWLPGLEAVLRLLGELSFIKEAGVAGDGTPGRDTGAEAEELALCGATKGECFADRGLGIGGGGISTSGGATSLRA